MDIHDVRELSNSELIEVLNDQKKALLNVRFGVATRQISDTTQLRKTRKTIARLMTVVREREIVTNMRLARTPRSESDIVTKHDSQEKQEDQNIVAEHDPQEKQEDQSEEEFTDDEQIEKGEK